MRSKIFMLVFAGASLLGLLFYLSASRPRAKAEGEGVNSETIITEGLEPQEIYRSDMFEVEVLVGGRPIEQYMARGRRYVEALKGAEYELRIRNPLGVRVAVALSVDGMNTIDARRSSAWDASKWVIEPYQTITIRGWQMSSARARRFYFTSERDSYGAKLGQTNNLGVITAVFFRERRPIVITPRPGRSEDESSGGAAKESSRSQSAPQTSANRAKRGDVYPGPDDESAATGIGRNVRNDVRWVNMDLDSRPAGEVNIRYEYRDALIRLGIMPRPYPIYPDTMDRRERSTGFEDRRYSPEP